MDTQKSEFWQKPIFPGLLFVLLSLGLYWQSVGFGYVLDDTIVLDENKFVAKGFSGIWDILSKESFTGYFGEQKNLVAGARYRPLSIVSFAIEQQILGKNPWFSHLINILLYAICGWLIYRLGRLLNLGKSLGWEKIFPLIFGILFICHPIHTEAVANIKGRDEIMCLLFSLLTAIYTLKFIDYKSQKYSILSSLCFFLALMSKENAITFLLVIPLILVFFRSEKFWPSIRQTWYLWIVAAVFLFIRTRVIGFFFDSGIKITDLMNDPFIGMYPLQKISTILFCIGWYLKLLLFPHPLTHDYYPYHVPKMNPTDAMTLLSLLMILSLVACSYYFRKKEKVGWFSVLYFFITISIVSNLIFPVGTFMNERFLFMPSLSFSFFCAYLAVKGLESNWKASKILVYSILSLVVVSYGIKTILRVPDWKDSLTLNLAGAAVSKNSARINLFTGVSYFHLYEKEMDVSKKKEYLDIANRYIDRSLIIFPAYGQGLNMKAGILAEYHKMSGDLDNFLDGIRKVIVVKPDLSFVNEYLSYISKKDENKHKMYLFLREMGYQVLFKKMKRYDFAYQYINQAHEMRPYNLEVSKEMVEILDAYLSKPGINPQQVGEMRKKAEALRLQNTLMEPKNE
ncbi:MAG TPA: hypothetical protein PLN76_01455 [Saprospiraceae bacterium]|nr:hypothetical protein [Saprospiraceae bacterium]